MVVYEINDSVIINLKKQNVLFLYFDFFREKN